MIQLKPDCLIFKTSDGEQIPYSAESATNAMIRGIGMTLEPDIVQNASAAVLHYFKHELKQNYVSVDEFTDALEKVFRNLRVDFGSKNEAAPIRVEEADLKLIAMEAGKELELLFFQQLRAELKRRLQECPQILRFRGLRECAKLLAGSTRWNRRCQTINDQIVDYLRTCWSAEPRSQSSALIVL